MTHYEIVQHLKKHNPHWSRAFFAVLESNERKAFSIYEKQKQKRALIKTTEKYSSSELLELAYSETLLNEQQLLEQEFKKSSEHIDYMFEENF